MWTDRIRETIWERGRHVRIFADACWGVDYVLSTFRTSTQSVIYVELEESDQDNSIRQGNRLSDAVYRGTGARLFGLGVPVSYGLNLIEKNRDYLVPSIVVINNANFGKQLTDGLALIAADAFRVIEIHPESELEGSSSSQLEAICPVDLAVLRHEAVDMFSTHLTSSEIEDLLRDAGGAYATLLASVNRRVALPPPMRPSFGVQEDVKGSDAYSPAVLDFLVRERRWMEAFELAVRTSQFERATAILGQAGESYFEAGLFMSFWDLIRLLPKDVFDEDVPAYWLLSASITLNRQDEVKEALWKALSTNAMPNLRALMACSSTSAGSLEEAERAFASSKTVMTVRALSHCLTSFGRPHEALRVALDNLSEIERFATPRELANYAYTISRILLFLGRFSAALEWANWGLKIYQEARLKEELLKLSLVSAKAYYSLLLGEPQVTKAALSSISMDRDLAGIPSMDAVFSTAADLAMVSGRYEEALDLYSLNHRQSPREQIGYTVIDLVGAMVMCGMHAEAKTLASECQNLASRTHERNAALTRLAVGIANAHQGSTSAKDQLSAAIKYYTNANDSIGIGRAALALAQVYWRANQRDKAVQTLLDVREHINDLGKSGWRLLGLPTPECSELWEHFHRDESHLKLNLLGHRVASYRGREHILSLRNAEILALLASEPTGVTGEELALDLYGEMGSVGTLKSSISKLRQLIPISSRPYALDTRYEADHVIIQRLITEGRIADALQLYRGPLLAESEAPGVERLREVLSESVRQAVLNSGDRSLLLQYCQKFSDDLHAVEELHKQLETEDPQNAAVSALLARIRREWEISS